MIGILESGLGGLAVAQEVRRLLPRADLRYVADQAHAPYGDREPAEVADLTRGLVDGLIDAGAGMIVLASNTISAAALHRLRVELPGRPFVGMEPAVKPAVALSPGGVVAVLGTTATIRGPLLADMISRHGGGATILPIALPGLVERIEDGMGDSPDTDAFLAERLGSAMEAGADTWVLACTHYTFARASLERVLGRDAAIIDPARAVAQQVARLHDHGGAGRAEAVTTGDPGRFAGQIESLALGLSFDSVGVA